MEKEEAIIKKRILCSFVWGFMILPCFAGDHIVQFVQEHYKETQPQFANSPVIYHTIQVISQAGPKLLILTGDTPSYRKWLRQYLSKNSDVIVRVPDEKNDLFISSMAFEIDVTNIQPIKHSSSQNSLSNQILHTPPITGKIFDPARNQDTASEKKAASDLENARRQAELERLTKEMEQALEQTKMDFENMQQQAAILEQISLEENRLQETEKGNRRQKRKEEADLRWIKQKKMIRIRDRTTAMEQKKRQQERELRWLEKEKARLLRN